MASVAANSKRFIGQSVGNGQCVAFARAAALLPHTSLWSRGEWVREATLVVGTAIATFDPAGRYINDTHGRSHVAIYMGQTASGIIVLDQWVTTVKGTDGKTERLVQPVHQRTIWFRNSTKMVNDGRNYYVVE